MASPLSMALKAAPAAIRLAGALRSASAASGAHSKPKLNINVRVQVPRKMSGTTKKNASTPGKTNLKTLGKTANALSRAASHMQAMRKQPGLGGLLKHGLKAAKELKGAARELSKLNPAHGARKGEASTHADSGARTSVAQPKGVKLMVGRPKKNWEEATPENGFREAYRGKPGADGKSLRVMVGKPQKNWEHATAENGFREAYRGKPGADGKSLRVMVGKPKKNWEQATPENGFTEWKGGKSHSSEPGGPRLKIMIGKPQMNWREALEQASPHEGGRPCANALVERPDPTRGVGLQINVQFGRSGAKPGGKTGKTSLSDLIKVARHANALARSLRKSHE